MYLSLKLIKKEKRGEKKMKKNKIAVLSLSILLLGANTVMASDVKIKNVDNFKAPAYEAMVKEYKSI